MQSQQIPLAFAGGEASQPEPDRREDEEGPELQGGNTNGGLKARSPVAYKCLIYFPAAVPLGEGPAAEGGSTCLWGEP